MMKRVIFLIGGITVATAGFCGVGQYSDATICYVYKQDTLQKKLTCRYDVVEGAAMSYSFRQVSYTLPGFGKMATSNQANYNDRNKVTGWTTTVNDEPAIIRYRLPSISNLKAGFPVIKKAELFKNKLENSPVFIAAINP